MQKEFEDQWDNSLDETIDMVDIAEKMVSSLEFNQGNWSCNEYRLNEDQIEVDIVVDFEGKYGDIHWLTYSVMIEKNLKKSQMVQAPLVEREESIYSYKIEQQGDNVNSDIKGEVEAKVQRFFDGHFDRRFNFTHS